MPHQAHAMHVSLNVHDLERSSAFYAALLGQPPAKRREDYAKFEHEEPALVLTLNDASDGPQPESRSKVGLSHLGVRVATDATIDEARARIVAAGLEVSLEEPGVTCCYALQNKFWVADPDGNAWEWYRVLADTDERDGEAADSACCSTDVASSTAGVACSTEM